MPDLIGRKLGKYQLEERLGRGGMAEVYKAFQPGVERHVAVKVMHGHLSDNPEFVQRFQREARSIGQLQHPHIGRVIDFDVEADVYYMVMDYIQGGALDGYLKQQGALAVDEAVQITLQLADALAYAHQRGMIHRDIKPGNILFMDEAHTHALLTDFGIARLLGEQSQMTMAGALVGTPNYMSPEAAQGEPCDARADIYSLGVVLYELVTGRTPYAAETPYSFLMKQANEPLPLPRTLNPRLPVAVEAVLLKALEKNPQARYQSAAEFAAALRAAQKSPVDFSSANAPGGKQSARPWRSLTLAAGGVLLVAVLTVLALMRMGNDGPTRVSTSSTQATLLPGAQVAAVVAATATATPSPIPTATPTSPPTKSPTETPTIAPAATAETAALVPVTLGALHLADAGASRAAAFALTLDQMRLPPAGHHYELWLAGDLVGGDVSLRLGELAVEQGRIRYAGAAEQNLLAGFSRAEVRIVADGEETAGQVVLVSQHPAAFASALREMLGTGEDNPGLLPAAQSQLAIAVQHGGFLADALAAQNFDEARRHAEHIVNILDGESGTHYGDLNGDGQAQNPGNGYGVRAYLQDAAAPLASARAAVSATQSVQLYADQLLAAQTSTLARSEQAIETVLKVFAADSLAEAQPIAPAVVELLDAAAVGVDRDENGIVEPAQESGLLTAYALALRLADYSFTAPENALLPASADAFPLPAGWLRLADSPMLATPATTPTPAARSTGGNEDSYNYGSTAVKNADAPIPASRFTLELGLLPLPPANRQYVAWLVGPTGVTRALGILPLAARPVLTGTTDENLLLNYARVLITSEAIGPVPEQMGEQVWLVGEHSTSFLSSLQNALFRSQEHEGGLLAGAREQMGIAIAHGGFLEDALDNDLAEARRHAEHIINVIEGKEGQHFGDLDRDGLAQNPGDGVGVRVYLLAAREQMTLAAAAISPTIESGFYAERYLAANEHSLLLLEHAYEKALQIFAADSAEEARPLAGELRARLHAALEGEDLDENGVIDPFADEGGIGVLYEMGLLLSQFALFEQK